MKNFFIGLIVGCLAMVVVWYLLPDASREKIQKAEKDLTDYKTMYKSTMHKADSLDAIIDTLQKEKEGFKSSIDSLNGAITVLQQQKKNEFYRIAGMFEPDSLVDEVKVTFPKFRNTLMGLIDVKSPRSGREITSYYFPVELVSSFIQDRKELIKANEENEARKKIGMTYESYVALQESVISLKEQKAQEFQHGFADGMKRYEALNKDYIDELKTPKLNFGLPTLGTMIGSAAVGYIVGRETHKNP